MIEIEPGILVFESSVCRMTSGLVLPHPGAARSGALLIDPGVLPVEVERIAAACEASRVRAGLMVLTHSHWDHVAGSSRFPETHVVASVAFADTASSAMPSIAEEVARADRRSAQMRRPPF